MKFKLNSSYSPQGDQIRSIEELVQGVRNGDKSQILLGVTGSGKTFTAANVIERLNRPTLIISHNKTLAAQLYGEFQKFFPANCVEYYVSYYDYYQPEAYIPQSNKYIAKDLAINSDLEKLRLRALSALVSGRRDIVIVSSVSCIYGLTHPNEFSKCSIYIERGQRLFLNDLLLLLVDLQYSRSLENFSRGNFRVVDSHILDIYLAYSDDSVRLIFRDNEVDKIIFVNSKTFETISDEKMVVIYPASAFVYSKEFVKGAISDIKKDLAAQIDFFINNNKSEEAKRLEQRTDLDIELLEELGYCPGVENYSRYFDNRKPGERPYCLFDYFPKDFILLIDESHVTISQIKAMWGGDHARKINLVENGFRLPSALDNRPLSFEEFESIVGQVIYISATPADYEIEKSDGVIVEQIIRPTGLLDPKIEVKATINQIDDILKEVHNAIEKKQRTLITTLTKRMAEELTVFMDKSGVKCRYIHSEVKTIDRVEILRELRLGLFDVLVGVNLLREGLDLPEVALVIILDADKQGFLRNSKSLIQTIGRAARNIEGRVIMYADSITGSMRYAIDETIRRREIQMNYNEEHQITPRGLEKTIDEIMNQTSVASVKKRVKNYNLALYESQGAILDYTKEYKTIAQIKEKLKEERKKMKDYASILEFDKAAIVKGFVEELEKELLVRMKSKKV